jgi:hypothetical protein
LRSQETEEQKNRERGKKKDQKYRWNEWTVPCGVLSWRWRVWAVQWREEIEVWRGGGNQRSELDLLGIGTRRDKGRPVTVCRIKRQVCQRQTSWSEFKMSMQISYYKRLPQTGVSVWRSAHPNSRNTYRFDASVGKSWPFSFR